MTDKLKYTDQQVHEMPSWIKTTTTTTTTTNNNIIIKNL